MNAQLIARLDAMITYVRENPHSTLYRDLYGDAVSSRIASRADWERLPFLEKEHIVAMPFWDRTFAPRERVDYIRASSGTSGKNLLVVPKTRTHIARPWMRPGAHRGILTFLQPPHQYEKDYWSAGEHIPIIAGDPTRLADSIRLMADAGLSGIQTYPYLLEEALPHIRSHALQEKITLLVLTGERIGVETARTYAAMFPNAIVALWYASIEGQGIPAYALVTPQTRELLYIPTTEYHFELVTDDGAVIEADDVEGEIVYTMLWADNVLPLIRYKTGDLGTRTRNAQGEIRYRILGRKHIDRIKVRSGEIRVEEVEEALARALGRAVEFELHYFKGTQPRILLKVAGTGDTELLARNLERMIKIAPETAYGTLISSGAHLPLTCEFVTDFPSTGRKKRRFHEHQ